MYVPEVLRIRSFRDLWLGQAISQLGDAIYYVAFMFMAERLTGSLAMVGYVGVAETLPYLLFGPYAGVLADRMDRKRIMLLSDLLCGGALLAYAGYVLVDPTPAVWTLLVVPFLLSTVRCFFMPAKTAAIPSLVPTGMLLKANAFSAATFNVMFLAGLAFAAGAISPLYKLSPQYFFVSVLALNGLSFLGSAIFVARLPSVQPDRSQEHEAHPWADFKSGLKFIGSRHDLKVLIAMVAAFRLGVSPFFVVYIAANKQWYSGHPSTIMWFEFSFFAGMILGSAWVGKFKVHRPMQFFMLSLAGVGVTVALMAFCRDSLWGFVAMNFLAGVLVPLADVPMITYLMASVEDRFRGRVNSVREMIGTGAMPLGMLLAGGMVQAWGLVAAFLIMGFGMIGPCLAGMLDPKFRDVRMPDDALLAEGPSPEPEELSQSA